MQIEFGSFADHLKLHISANIEIYVCLIQDTWGNKIQIEFATILTKLLKKYFFVIHVFIILVILDRFLLNFTPVCVLLCWKFLQNLILIQFYLNLIFLNFDTWNDIRNIHYGRLSNASLCKKLQPKISKTLHFLCKIFRNIFWKMFFNRTQ